MSSSTSAERFARLILSPDSTGTLKTQTVRSGVYSIAAEGVEFVLRLASIVILARLLVPEHFGLIAMVTAITSIAERFKDLGLSIATVQRPDITHEQVSTLFWVNLVCGAGLVLLISALAWPIAEFYREPRLTLITVVLAGSLFLGAFSVQHQALLRRRMQYGRIASIQIVSSAASVLVAVGLALADFGYWALVAREVSRSLFVAIGCWLCMPWIPGAPRRSTGVRSMLGFGGNVTSFNLIAFLAHNLDQIVIGRLTGAESLGMYRQGVNLVLAPMTQLAHPVNSVAESALSRLQNAPAEYRRYYMRIVGTLSLATMPLCAFIVVFADEIVQLALGPKWLPATEFFRTLAIAAFIRPASATVGAIMVSCGFSRRYLLWGLAGSTFMSAMVLLGSQWGATGVAYSHVAFSYLWLAPILFIGLKGSPVSPRDFMAAVYRPAFASIVMGAAIKAIQLGVHAASPIVTLVWGTPVAALVFVAALAVLPGGRAELGQLLDHLRSARRRAGPPAQT